MHDDFSNAGSSHGDESTLNRFLRGYFGAVPAVLAVAAVIYVAGLTDLAEIYGDVPMVAGLLILPAVVSIFAMQSMPAGREGGFLRAKLLPMLGDGLRGLVLIVLFLAMWAFGVFLVLGALGMVWTGLRSLF